MHSFDNCNSYEGRSAQRRVQGRVNAEKTPLIKEKTTAFHKREGEPRRNEDTVPVFAMILILLLLSLK